MNHNSPCLSCKYNTFKVQNDEKIIKAKITANTTDKWMMKYSKVPTDCRDCAMFLELQDQLYLI